MIIQKCNLFEGIDAEQTAKILKSCKAVKRRYQKGSTVINEGETVNEIGIVESGELEGVRFFANGNRDVAAVFEAGDVFGGVLAVSGEKRSPVSVVCKTDCEVLFLNFENVLSDAYNGNTALLHNILKCVCDKYFSLDMRVKCLAQRSIREKIMFYLNGFAKKAGEPFNIPLDRTALADYLSADRSALSRELSNMKTDGIIDYYKNTFVILK